MRIRAERCPLNRRSLLHPVVPEYNLPGVRSAEDQVRVELGEAGRHDGTLTVEHVLRGVLLELGVPNDDHTVRLVRRFLVVVVRRDHQLREVR